jgi:hypothetical protein
VIDSTCNVHGEVKNAYRFLARNPHGKRPRAIGIGRWESNIKMVPEKYSEMNPSQCHFAYYKFHMK